LFAGESTNENAPDYSLTERIDMNETQNKPQNGKDFMSKLYSGAKLAAWIVMTAFTLGMGYNQFVVGKQSQTGINEASIVQLKLEIQQAETRAVQRAEDLTIQHAAENRKLIDANTTDVAVVKNDIAAIKASVRRIEDKLDKLR
jgi:uncharacterized protein HemX